MVEPSVALASPSAALPLPFALVLLSPCLLSPSPRSRSREELLPYKPFSPPSDTHSLVLRPFRSRFLFLPRGVPALEMVIAGAPEPSPGHAAAWLAVVARPPAGPERATMATEPPLPPAPRHVTAVSEETHPHAPAPLVGAEAGPTAPAAVPSAPLASPGTQAPLGGPSASAPQLLSHIVISAVWSLIGQ
ncbi:unnamed protein product [Closterium sp. NIES-54]